MTDKKDKFEDLDLDEVLGKIEKTINSIKFAEELPTEDELREIAAENDDAAKEVIEWEACLERMNEHTKKIWIALPQNNGQVAIYDAITCSNEIFFEWMLKVWPPAKKLNHKPEDYSKEKYRHGAIVNIANLHQATKIIE